MEEFLDFIRRVRGQQAPSQTAAVNQQAPNQEMFAPRSFQDTLSAIVGRPVNVRSGPVSGRVPEVFGATAVTQSQFPGTIFATPEVADSRSVLAHEVGHLVDFANSLGEQEAEIKETLGDEATEEERDDLIAARTLREAGELLGVLREDPLVTERFAEEFEGALLDPRVRNAKPDALRRMLQSFIDERLERHKRRAAQGSIAARDATNIVRR